MQVENCKKPLMCTIFGHKFVKGSILSTYTWHKCFRCGFDVRRTFQ